MVSSLVKFFTSIFRQTPLTPDTIRQVCLDEFHRAEIGEILSFPADRLSILRTFSGLNNSVAIDRPTNPAAPITKYINPNFSPFMVRQKNRESSS
jgi:hypothetical protein